MQARRHPPTVSYELLRPELRAFVPDERGLAERDAERDPVERDAVLDPVERDVVRAALERVELFLAVLLPAVPAGFLSGVTLARSLSNSLSASRLAFLASRCKFFNALVTSLYALWAPLLMPLPADCKAVPASSSSFSTRCCARSTSRRVVACFDAVADDVRLVERAAGLRAPGFRAAVVLRAAGFLAGGMASPC